MKCTFCDKSNDVMWVCNQIYYCSIECFKTHWKYHHNLDNGNVIRAYAVKNSNSN